MRGAGTEQATTLVLDLRGPFLKNRGPLHGDSRRLPDHPRVQLQNQAVAVRGRDVSCRSHTLG